MEAATAALAVQITEIIMPITAIQIMETPTTETPTTETLTMEITSQTRIKQFL